MPSKPSSILLTALLLATTHLATAQNTTTAPATTTFTASPGGPCGTGLAYCAGGPIILRCAGTTLQPGNCDDNLNEPPYGATCTGPAGSAYCMTNPGPNLTATATSTTTSVSASTTAVGLTYGGTCTGTAAQCAGTNGPIIFRCETSSVVAGNCDDNLGEPSLGAYCAGAYPTASCVAYSATTSVTYYGNTTTTTPSPSTSTSVTFITPTPVTSSIGVTSTAPVIASAPASGSTSTAVASYTGAAARGAQMLGLNGNWAVGVAGAVVAFGIGGAMFAL